MRQPDLRVVAEEGGRTRSGYLVPMVRIPHATARETFDSSPLSGLTNPLPTGSQGLDEMLKTTPVDQAGREGWICFRVPGLRGEDAGRGTLTMKFKDSLGREHTIRAPFVWTAGRLALDRSASVSRIKMRGDTRGRKRKPLSKWRNSGVLVEAAGVEFERSAFSNFLMARDLWC